MTATDYALISVAGVQALATVVLVIVTIFYAISSRKMAREMEQQKLITAKPIIIQRAVHKDIEKREDDAFAPRYFSHFEIYNAGNSPAIELEMAIIIEDKSSYRRAMRETYLRAGESIRKLQASDMQNMTDSKTYYFVSECQGTLSHAEKQMWYQTWLPFKVDEASAKGELYVSPGELKFKEVDEKGRISNIVVWNKPK